MRRKYLCNHKDPKMLRMLMISEASQFLGHLEFLGHANFIKRGMAAKADKDKVTRTLS